MQPDFLVYFAAFAAPFVQEDAAVWGGVSAFTNPDLHQIAHAQTVLVAMIIGLVGSDLWKYWIGYFGKRHSWATKLTQKPEVLTFQAKVLAHPGLTLVAARFIPGSRIPAYLAAGLFGVPFVSFAFWIVVSALAYVFAAWAILQTLGDIAGESAQVFLAVAVIAVICVLVGFNMLRGAFKPQSRALKE